MDVITDAPIIFVPFDDNVQVNVPFNVSFEDGPSSSPPLNLTVTIATQEGTAQGKYIFFS